MLLEEISLNTWPAERNQLLDGWVLRMTAGYTKRANSVSPLYGPAELDGIELEQKIDRVEHCYALAKLPAVFKISPGTRPSGLDAALAARGYEIVQPSAVMTLSLGTGSLPSSGLDVSVDEEPTEEWLQAFTELAELSEQDRETHRAILANSGLPQGYALLRKEGVPVACGLAVLQHGYLVLYDIITAPAHRRQGLAQELLYSLLRFGLEQGAAEAMLQVVKSNGGAVALYSKLGFQEQYTYWYRVRSQR